MEKNKLGKPHEFKFNLGDRLRDQITGFTGICFYRTQWLSNCNNYGLKPLALKDGVPQDTVQFDEPFLDMVEEKVHDEKRATGGPTPKMRPSNIM